VRVIGLCSRKSEPTERTRRSEKPHRVPVYLWKELCEPAAGDDLSTSLAKAGA
jgi:hypothetical protein